MYHTIYESMHMYYICTIRVCSYHTVGVGSGGSCMGLEPPQGFKWGGAEPLKIRSSVAKFGFACISGARGVSTYLVTFTDS